jgi:hypothetical protein
VDPATQDERLGEDPADLGKVQPPGFPLGGQIHGPDLRKGVAAGADGQSIADCRTDNGRDGHEAGFGQGGSVSG